MNDNHRVILTPRWTKLKPHDGQAAFFWSPVPIKVCTSGRRSGKTEITKRKFIKKLMKARRRPLKMFAAAPTLDQAREIFWDDLKALIPPSWIEKIYESPRLRIVTRWGDFIRVVGLDKPERIEGVAWDWGVIDELANAKPNLLDNHILPAMSTIGVEPSLDLIGVPDESGPNQNEFEKYYETGLGWPHVDRKVCSFHWPSSDILEPEKIDDAKRRMDPLTFAQEYGGRFVRGGGRVLPYFDPTTHIRADTCVYRPNLPLDWSLDFGTRHLAHVIGQTYKGMIWILDEIALQDSSTDVAADVFREKCIQRGWSTRRIRLFGDAAGHTAGSNVGKTDYDIIFTKLRDFGLEDNTLRANPLVKDTVNAVRSAAMTADGAVHLNVHPRCENLIKDCKRAPWPDGSNRLRDYHWLAALRYYCHELADDRQAYAVEAAEIPNVTGR